MLGECSKCPTFTALKPKECISGIYYLVAMDSNENGRVEKTGIYWGNYQLLSTAWKTISLFSEAHIHQEETCNYLHLRNRWKVTKLAMKKLSFKLILLKILQLKYKMLSIHSARFRSSLLSLLRVYGKKMVVIYMLLSQIICYMISTL